MKTVTRRELVREMIKFGYQLKRTRGSHEIYTNGKRTVSVPVRLNPCIAIRLLKEVYENE